MIVAFAIRLADWLTEFRTLSVVYIGLARSLSSADVRRGFSAIETVTREAAVAIWDVIDEDKGVIVKIVLGGSSNADDLADLSRLIGEREVREWSETRHGSSKDRSVSSSTA